MMWRSPERRRTIAGSKKAPLSQLRSNILLLRSCSFGKVITSCSEPYYYYDLLLRRTLVRSVRSAAYSNFLITHFQSLDRGCVVSRKNATIIIQSRYNSLRLCEPCGIA